MILNIDLGSMYIKVAVVDDIRKQLITSEVIRVVKTGKGALETLLRTVVDNYSKMYDIKRIYLIPSPLHVKCETISYEPILEDKYDKLMKSEIARNKKEEKKRERMGDEYEPPTAEQVNKYKYEPISFSHSLDKNEVFHKIEYSDLVSSQIYVEYVEKEYLRTLTSITSLIQGKDVRIISPIRLMMALPFPKRNRIIINYGQRSILKIVIEVDKTTGKEFIKEITNEIVADDIIVEHSELVIKHESTTLLEDPIYMSKLADIKSTKEKYKGYDVYAVGGNATYVQNDLFFRNKLDDDFKLSAIPLTLENVLLPVLFTEYDDFQYNDLKMNLKNRVVNVSALSTQASKAILEVGGNLAIAGLVIAIVFSYGVSAEYMYYKGQVENLQKTVVTYNGDGTSQGRIQQLEAQLDATMNGKTKNYYNIAELLTTMASPLEIESIDVVGKSIKVIAYSDNVALVRQFLETVKAKQVTNKYTQFTLSETDITTVYKNGRKLDRVVLEGSIY